MRRAVVTGAALALALVAGTARLAAAEPNDVPAMIKLIETQPAEADRSAWKEQRREAAKKLAQSKDKRAVPELIKLAETETFDIIGEIAIEGLGTVGDPSAVPALQKIAADNARDKSQRELAKKSLAKLGASATTSGPPQAPAAGPVPPPAPVTTVPTTAAPPTAAPATGLETSSDGSATAAAPPPTSSTSSGSALLDTGAPQSSAPPILPQLSDDTLAAYDRITFAGGTASVAYDTITKRLDATADVSGLWQKRVERQAMAWGVDAGAHVVAGVIDPTGRAYSRGTEIDANADGEARFYYGNLYGIGRASADLQVDYVGEDDATNAANDIHQTTSDADLEVALGGGYGRQLDIGAAIRVRRLARALEANRALGRPIDAATSKKLQLTWWALRAERSTYRALVATIAILRESGVLLAEPDGGLTYEILNVLRDSYVYMRPSGFDANLELGGGYLRRPAGLVAQNVENGRVEQLLASAGYATQLDDDKLELVGSAYGRLQLFAGDGVPAPYAIGATATMTRFTYGDHGDPFGSFDLTAAVQYSSDDRTGVDAGLGISGQLGFTYLINQASGIRLAATVAEDDGTVQLGAQLSGTYGLLDGTFAR